MIQKRFLLGVLILRCYQGVIIFTVDVFFFPFRLDRLLGSDCASNQQLSRRLEVERKKPDPLLNGNVAFDT